MYILQLQFSIHTYIFCCSSKPTGGSGADGAMKSGHSHKSITVPSDWMCTICSYINFARRTSCYQVHILSGIIFAFVLLLLSLSSCLLLWIIMSKLVGAVSHFQLSYKFTMYICLEIELVPFLFSHWCSVMNHALMMLLQQIFHYQIQQPLERKV